MKIIWSPLAVDRVRDIATYIALNKSVVAVQWAEKIFNCVELLSAHPEGGRVVSEINRKDIREYRTGKSQGNIQNKTKRDFSFSC